MDPLLVITNSDAGPADEESLQRALAVLRVAQPRSRCRRPPTRAS